MRARLQKLCGPEVARALWVGTFHATCAKLLRAHGDAVGVQPNFVIYDAADQKAVVSRALKELDLDERRFPAARRARRPSTSTSRRAAARTRRRPHSYMDDIALKVFRAYEERLRAANAVDFEDLILLVARLLEKTAEGDRIRRRYDYVLVDEFQDTNSIAVPLPARPGARPQEPLRRRRRRPEHLPLARRRRAQHPRLPPRLSRTRRW